MVERVINLRGVEIGVVKQNEKLKPTSVLFGVQKFVDFVLQKFLKAVLLKFLGKADETRQ